MRSFAALALVYVLELLSGCGQKGPLVLPDAQKHKPVITNPVMPSTGAPSSATPVPTATPTPMPAPTATPSPTPASSPTQSPTSSPPAPAPDAPSQAKDDKSTDAASTP